MKNPISKWHEVVATQDQNLLKSILAENVTFYSPVVFTPQKGRELNAIVLNGSSSGI